MRIKKFYLGILICGMLLVPITPCYASNNYDEVLLRLVKGVLLSLEKQGKLEGKKLAVRDFSEQYTKRICPDLTSSLAKKVISDIYFCKDLMKSEFYVVNRSDLSLMEDEYVVNHNGYKIDDYNGYNLQAESDILITGSWANINGDLELTLAAFEIVERKSLVLISIQGTVSRRSLSKSLLACLNRDKSEDVTLDIKKVMSGHDKKEAKYGSLHVETYPEDAKVQIMNIKPRYYDGIKLKKGTYHIRVSAAGYETQDKFEKVRYGESLSVYFDLKSFKATPARQVYRDGNYKNSNNEWLLDNSPAKSVNNFIH
ncbi:hypothetical protein [Maridesulfovibrio zosterae]|uniref:hypothetical protein n=1 Tax=Maridesulfovibrio zosterae TaxID=82171 RepID=UPI0003F87F33|nr:hypothetical protein [Maridesulfovibrio zosterae]